MAVLSPMHVPTNYASLWPSRGVLGVRAALEHRLESVLLPLLLGQLLLAHRSMSLGSCFLCTSLTLFLCRILRY